MISKYNLPDFGSEPWSSLHDFDEIFDRKFGKPAVSEVCVCLLNRSDGFSANLVPGGLSAVFCKMLISKPERPWGRRCFSDESHFDQLD